MVCGFLHFLQFQSDFGNKGFMIWAIVSSQSYFCWLCIASPSLAAKNIINLILVLVILWCSRVESCLVLLEECVCYDQCIFLQNCISLCPASSHTWKPNLPVTPGISWLPIFAFQSPIMKRTSFLGICSTRSYRSSWNCSISASSALLVRAQTWITVLLNGLPWKWAEIIL